MYVFRSERRMVSGKGLLRGLRDALLSASSQTFNSSRVLDALLRAGELECALADARCDDSQLVLASSITDALADSLVRASRPSRDLLNDAAQLCVPELVTIAKPEGFAYYGLHPLAYARLVNSLPDNFNQAAVIGLRSIGTTLSAVVMAALRVRGKRAERITTRPEGHPFDRHCHFAAEQLPWSRSQCGAGANFLVVDEGPGLSGSSLLSVGEALVAAGVPIAAITLLCSHNPDPERLQAPNANRRWKSFRSVGLGFGERTPRDAGDWIGTGVWRDYFLRSENGSGYDRPACWPQMERAKYFTRNYTAVYKFEGLGRYGSDVVQRSRQLADLRLGPRITSSAHLDGYACYERVTGHSLADAKRHDTSAGEEVLRRLARYCAIRAKEFACDLPQPAPDEVSLEEMCRENAREEFGIEMLPAFSRLPCERPVIADAHMMPHEWIETPSGKLVKIDGASHGDDHFFPGPCDIAWDLAGVIVEWRLPQAAAEFFLREYRRASRDDPSARLDRHLLAYLLFRMGYCKMASEAMHGSDEEGAFRKAFQHYRALAWAQLTRAGFEAEARAIASAQATNRSPKLPAQRSAALLP